MEIEPKFQKSTNENANFGRFYQILDQKVMKNAFSGAQKFLKTKKFHLPTIWFLAKIHSNLSKIL